MNTIFDNATIVGFIKNHYARREGLDVSVNLRPVVVEKHYEVICDTIIEVCANNEKQIIDNNGLQFILNSELENSGYRVFDVSCNTLYEDGKPRFNGVKAFVNREPIKVYARSR